MPEGGAAQKVPIPHHVILMEAFYACCYFLAYSRTDVRTKGTEKKGRRSNVLNKKLSTEYGGNSAAQPLLYPNHQQNSFRFKITSSTADCQRLQESRFFYCPAVSVKSKSRDGLKNTIPI